MARTGECAAVIGFPERAGVRDNAAAVCAGGQMLGVYRKKLLPNYSVFDEKRYFEASTDPGALFEIAGVEVAVSICEDAWEPGPILRWRGTAPSWSSTSTPRRITRAACVEREAMLAERCVQAATPIVYVNIVGGQDELVFDGASVVFGADGKLGDARQAVRGRSPHRRSRGRTAPDHRPDRDGPGAGDSAEDSAEALVLGTHGLRRGTERLAGRAC